MGDTCADFGGDVDSVNTGGGGIDVITPSNDEEDGVDGSAKDCIFGGVINLTGVALEYDGVVIIVEGEQYGVVSISVEVGVPYANALGAIL